MSERTNDDRRLTAQAALEAACLDRGEAPVANDPDTVTDLLTDLRHFCAAEGIDYAACDSMAASHWQEEAFIDYLNAVDNLLRSKYGVTSHDVDVAHIADAQEDGWTPEQVVEWFAEKYDLDGHEYVNVRRNRPPRDG